MTKVIVVLVIVCKPGSDCPPVQLIAYPSAAACQNVKIDLESRPTGVNVYCMPLDLP